MLFSTMFLDVLYFHRILHTQLSPHPNNSLTHKTMRCDIYYELFESELTFTTGSLILIYDSALATAVFFPRQ